MSKILLYNPLNEDFKVKYDGKYYSIRSKETKRFKKSIADHVIKHLSKKMFDTVGSYSERIDDQMVEFKKKIETGL